MTDATGRAGASPARILFLSHSHPFGAFRVGSHHYARALSQRGADVVHLSTPISLVHRLTGRVDRQQLARVPRRARRDDDGVLQVVPRTILPAPVGAPSVARMLQREGISAGFDAVLIDQPLLWDRSVRSLSERVIYRPTDLYPGGLKNALQRRILAEADGVVATSDEVLRGLGALHVPSLVLGNGAEVARFAQPAAEARPRPARCVYVGALDDRFDWERVEAWARARPEVEFVIAGPDGRPPRPVPSNVDVVGPVPYADVPALLHTARVGLLPLSDSPLNAGRSPMKLYEYLAAGLAVVARETPGIRASPDLGIEVYTDVSDADAALERALGHPSPNRAGGQAASSASWEHKTDSLEEFLRSVRRRRA
ncbi:glycosyltransferase [uncultured Microbacterium sp.]|uniref:glycosyltransferase family protein n=1 Tax=uncultured Microbacterium sp. TaxID=191216 RepID=UPI0025E43321|nr:glycosyltransferase [uncultured Microbacterium sp.]